MSPPKEVKGEWSLPKLSSILTPQTRYDSELATKKYLLLKETMSSETLYTGKESNSFQKYPSRLKEIKKEIAEVSILSNSLYTLIRKIYQNDNCIYPKAISFCYSKKESIILKRPKTLKLGGDKRIHIIFRRENEKNNVCHPLKK